MNEEQTSCSGDWMSEGQTDYKRSLAYRYLGIRPEDVPPAPFFAINLRNIARCINQGRKGASSRMHQFDYLELSEDPEARKVVEKYRTVPASYRRLLQPQAYCCAAGVSTDHERRLAQARITQQQRNRTDGQQASPRRKTHHS